MRCTSLYEIPFFARGLGAVPRLGRQGRRQLKAHALLHEIATIDLPSAVMALQHVGLSAGQVQAALGSLTAADLGSALSTLGLDSTAGAAAAAAAAAAPSSAAAGEALAALQQVAVEHLLLLGDATAQVQAAAADGAAAQQQQQGLGFLQPLVDVLETVLSYLQDGLDKVNCPYSYGYSIILLTLLVKIVTFPLTKQQVESGMAVQELKPQIEEIKAKYGEDKQAIQREQSALYEKAGVNPLAGCLPTLATIPIFIGLYRSLSNSATSGAFDNQGFYWVPSLAGPTTLAAQKAGAGVSWLYPLVDGAPPIGWEAAIAYLILPVLVVLSQYVSSAIITPPMDPEDPNTKTQKAILAFLPLMVGWFSLNVPSGLALYYLSNTVFTTAIQIWLRKLGGADVKIGDLGPIALGKARRTGTVAGSVDDLAGSAEPAEAEAAAAGNGATAGAAPVLAVAAAPGAGADSALDGLKNGAEALAAPVPSINRRCKRKKRELLAA